MNAADERAHGEPVVVGVDGSEPSLRAVDWAGDEAVLRGVPLKVVYACLWERYEGAALARDIGKPSALPLAQDVAGAAAQRASARHPGLQVSADVVFEEPEYALVREARNACALVVGTRGRSGIAEMLLGSVSLAVAAQADCPVIVLRGTHDNQSTPPVHGRIVVGVGKDVKESAAVRFAAEEARRRGVPLEAIRAWRCPAHESTDHPLLASEPARLHEERAAEELEAALQDLPPDADVHRRTVEGHARRVLADASHSADLLVVGANRRDGHVGLQLGRVSHAVLHHSACPVAIVPHRGHGA
ncbi:universal stress protein [Streptomyces sp. SAI-090]|jgi:nucleotide-binding universal stress UspA family protein|uniref:universal stress protein n=1 Tax=Streptomyces sp. SAI-090 TaxID=2940545 RepID=UPI0024752691|nr:universal stress protein [Streptomyces sp. SAI-090]MDH6522184.1 nucleotide-binding universal stress UspA family protein [Streptomyces sp. SAI-090]